MNYLHSRGIIHRDVKAANILLNDRAEIKLADFGVSGYFGSVAMKKETVGTPLWMAPEVLRRNPAAQSSDIWSMGITVIEMGDGKPPNHDISVLRAMRLTIDPNTPPPTLQTASQFSPTFIDFVAQLLIKTPTKRPSAFHLLSHPFLFGILGDPKLRQQMLATLLLVRSGKVDEGMQLSPSPKLTHSGPKPGAKTQTPATVEPGTRSRTSSDPKVPVKPDAALASMSPEEASRKMGWVPARLVAPSGSPVGARRLSASSKEKDAVAPVGMRRGDDASSVSSAESDLSLPSVDSPKSPFILVNSGGAVNEGNAEINDALAKRKSASGAIMISGRTSLSSSNPKAKAAFSKRWDNVDPDSAAMDAWVYSFGMNARHQLALDYTDDELLPAPITFLENSPELFSVGGHHSLFLAKSGVLANGDNVHGQLGLGPTFNSAVSSPPQPLHFFEDRQIDALFCGLSHSFVLVNPNKLYAFGKNSSGQIGLDNPQSQCTPQLVRMPTRSNIVSVACGSEHTLICTADGKLYGMGSDELGQLGLGGLRNESGKRLHTKPMPISFLGDKFIDGVFANGDFSIVKTRDGQLYAFGDNSCGQLGLPLEVASFDRPQFLSAFANEPVVSVACGYSHTLVLTELEHLYSFGKNSSGQLGLGDVVDRSTPTLMFYFANKKVLEVACGTRHSLVLCDDGQVFAFGLNANGQLGLGNDHIQPTPQQVPAFINRPAVSIGCGANSSIV